MSNTIRTKEFNKAYEISYKLVVKNKIDLTKVFIIYAGDSIKGIYKAVMETAKGSSVNIIAFGSKDTLVAGPSIDNILCILKEKN